MSRPHVCCHWGKGGDASLMQQALVFIGLCEPLCLLKPNHKSEIKTGI